MENKKYLTPDCESLELAGQDQLLAASVNSSSVEDLDINTGAWN